MWHINKSKLAIGSGVALALLVPSMAFAATQVQTTICRPLPEPTITAPATHTETSKSTMQVVGQATPGKVVTVLKNGAGAGATTVTNNGTYALEAPLDIGNNTISAQVSDECNTIKTSSGITVIRKAVAEQSTPQAPVSAAPAPVASARPIITGLSPTAATTPVDLPAPQTPTGQEQMTTLPVLVADEVDDAVTPVQKEIITKPKTGETIKTERMWVKGKAKPDSVVVVYLNRVIAAQVLAASDGMYGALVNLHAGNNTVLVQATAQDGTATNRVVSVKLVSATTSAKGSTATEDDTVAKIIIVTIGLGGIILTSLIMWHMPKPSIRGKR